MKAVRKHGRPFFGICVGMQLMAERGREYQVTPGWAGSPAKSTASRRAIANLKIPHMGWNTLNMLKAASVARGHSARAGRTARLFRALLSSSKPAQRADLVAQADYGGPLTAIVGRDNMVGTQFHPEKSQRLGLEADREFFEVGAVILFPAIDLKDGLAVRLEQGDMARATVFHRDPAAQAHAFEMQGFEYLHMVDLDGAFAGKPVNAAAVDRILEAVGHPRAARRRHPRHGDGRSLARQGRQPRDHRHRGGARSALWSRRRRATFPGEIAVGLDARDGKVAVEGWAETSELSALEIARRFEDAGVAAIVYTDIARDGMLKGLNLDATIALAEAMSIPVIASGGLASIDDIKALLAPRARKLAGAIAGRALYDGRLDAAEALKLIRDARTAA